MKSYWKQDSPIGPLWLVEDGTGISEITLHETFLCEDAQRKQTPLLQETQKQLEEYFAGERWLFHLPLSLRGTPFQRKVWQTLCQIPYGATWSYQQTAQAAGSPKACRAVGMANHCNPVMIVVPCHRVIGKDGSLTGYGCGLDVKRYLLALEKNCQARNAK